MGLTRFPFSIFATASMSTLAAALLLGVASPVAHAQTGYNDLTSFNAAATTATVYDFNSVPTGSNSPSLTPLTVTITNIGINGGGSGTNYSVRPASNVSSNTLNGTAFLQSAFNDLFNNIRRTTTIGFGTTYTAFGTEFGFRGSDFTVPLPTGTVSVQLFNGATAVGTALGFPVAQTGTFIGLTSTQAFDRATFTTTSENADASQAFDNVRVGTLGVTAAPEPSSLPLLGMGVTSGLAVVGSVRRRRVAKQIASA